MKVTLVLHVCVWLLDVDQKPDERAQSFIGSNHISRSIFQWTCQRRHAKLTGGRPGPPRFSKHVIHNHTLYIAGEVRPAPNAYPSFITSLCAQGVLQVRYHMT